MTIRSQILDANLTLPSYDRFVEAFGRDYADLANSLFVALFRAYLQNKGNISLPFWADKFADMAIFNGIIKSLSDSQWIITDAIPARNWAEARLNEDKLLNYCTLKELEQIRATKKFLHYVMEQPLSTKTRSTRLNGKTQDTGLVRRGAMLAGNTAFSVDINNLKLHEYTVRKELSKGMEKVIRIIGANGGAFKRDSATYDAILNTVLDSMMHNPSVYTRGDSYNDSRGRAISASLSKVANPIGNKTIRALLVIE